MAEITASYINPLIIHQKIDVDYESVLPSPNNVVINNQYQRALSNVEVYPVFLLNTAETSNYVSIQMFNDYFYVDLDAYMVLPDGSRVLMTRSIEYNNRKIYTYKPTTKGIHWIDFLANDVSTYYSDEFLVRPSDKDIIKFNYFDTQNRYGGYFFTSSESQIWSPVAFYTGFWKKDTPSDDQTLYKGQSGEEILLDSNPLKIVKLILTDIQEDYIDIIKQQVICDNFYMNDVKYTVTSFKKDDILDSNLVNIEMTLTTRDNNYYLW